MAEASINTISEGLKDLTISKSEIDPVGEEIGRGAYGRVYTVKYCGHIFAVKEIHSILVEGVGEEQQRSVKEGFLRECHHCSVLKHPNIVRFLGIYYPRKDSKIPAMIMELMDKSLTAYMKKLPKTALMRKGSILLDVAEGLSYLHALRPAVIHRDLFPNNILLKKSKGEVPVAKIADLGVAKVVKTDSRATRSKLTKAPGTVDFMAPEALGIKPVYGVKLDVFSYAGIILFVSTHKWPTPADQVQLDPETDEPVALSEVKRRKEYLDEMTGEAAGLRPLVESCLSNNPAKRPTIAEVSKKLKVLENDATLEQEADNHQISDSPPTLQHVEKSDHFTNFQSISTIAPVHNKPTAASLSLQSAAEPTQSTISGGVADPLFYESSSSKWTKPPDNVSPYKSPPSSIENTTSGKSTPESGPVQDRHSSSTLHEMPARDYNVKKPSLMGEPLNCQTMLQCSCAEVSTMSSHLSSTVDSHHSSRFESSHHKQSQEQNIDSSAAEIYQDCVNKPSSPQEESWVKQLLVAREKASQAGDQRKRQLDESEKRQFASGTAKFTTMFEDPTSGGDSDRRASSHKAALLPVDGPTIPDVKELLKPKEITKAEMKAVEMNVDQSTRLIFSLEIFLDSDEEMSKLIQAFSPDERGNWQMAFVLITNQTVYLLRKDGADHEGLDYSREIAIRLQNLSYLMIGLNWQSLVIAHEGSHLVVILTGNEAVTRTIIDAINEAHLKYNECIVPLNRCDDMRSKALMREVGKVDPQNGYLILLYNLVNWEQLKGDLPPLLMPVQNDEKSGLLCYKAVIIRMTYWKQGYFVIRKGFLYMYASKSDKVPKAQYPLQDKTCGGCKRVAIERAHSFMVVFNGIPDLVLSASTEEEMLDWMQALCDAVVGKKITPNQMAACISCGVLITSNKVCIMKEEWLNDQVSESLVTSCNIDDITNVDVDPLLPLYCILSYLPSERSDVESVSWLLCFESTHELSKFSIKLTEEWKKTFQIDIDFSDVKDKTLKQRAYKAVGLMQASCHRNNSITLW